MNMESERHYILSSDIDGIDSICTLGLFALFSFLLVVVVLEHFYPNSSVLLHLL